MTALVDGYIVNNTNSKKYEFRGLSPLDDRVSQNVIALPLVNTSASNQFLFRFSGQTEDIMFTFAIFDDGQDTSDGTHTSTVKTVNEQIDYLKTHIFTSDFDDDWTFTQTRYASSGITGVIVNLDFSNPAGHTNLVIARMTFKRGVIGAL